MAIARIRAALKAALDATRRNAELRISEERATRERSRHNQAKRKEWDRQTAVRRFEASLYRTLAYLAGAALVWLILSR